MTLQNKLVNVSQWLNKNIDKQYAQNQKRQWYELLNLDQEKQTRGIDKGRLQQLTVGFWKHKTKRTIVWIQKNGRDASGQSYTCTDMILS